MLHVYIDCAVIVDARLYRGESEAEIGVFPGGPKFR